MNERFKKLTRDLTAILEKKTIEFLLENLKEDENLSDVINLTMSGHVSSMFNVMREISQCDEEALTKTLEFIEKMTGFIKNCEGIVTVEPIGND